eukprot:2244727-Pleurochrysis_carterae.AAC.4
MPVSIPSNELIEAPADHSSNTAVAMPFTSHSHAHSARNAHDTSPNGSRLLLHDACLFSPAVPARMESVMEGECALCQIPMSPLFPILIPLLLIGLLCACCFACSCLIRRCCRRAQSHLSTRDEAAVPPTPLSEPLLRAADATDNNTPHIATPATPATASTASTLVRTAGTRSTAASAATPARSATSNTPATVTPASSVGGRGVPASLSPARR